MSICVYIHPLAGVLTMAPPTFWQPGAWGGGRGRGHSAGFGYRPTLFKVHTPCLGSILIPLAWSIYHSWIRIATAEGPNPIVPGTVLDVLGCWGGLLQVA